MPNPSGFVEVSGYSETDLQNSYNEGLADGGSAAIEDTTATQAQVLSGYTFSSAAAGTKKSGTMANQGAWNQIINPGAQVTIPAGYHSGSGKVTANPNQNSGTYTFPANDVGGTKDLGANNTYRYVNAQNVYSKGVADTKKGDAVVGNVLSGKTFTNSSGYQTGTMANQGAFSRTGDNALTPNASVVLPAGYHNGSGVISAKPMTGTYSFPANDTGATKDLGVANLYRYVNAQNVYNKGVADGIYKWLGNYTVEQIAHAAVTISKNSTHYLVSSPISFTSYCLLILDVEAACEESGNDYPGFEISAAGTSLNTIYAPTNQQFKRTNATRVERGFRIFAGVPGGNLSSVTLSSFDHSSEVIANITMIRPTRP